MFSTPDHPNNKTNDVIYLRVEVISKNVAYTYLIGHFPYRSSRGSDYMVTGYYYDVNTILLEPLKNRTQKYHTGM